MSLHLKEPVFRFITDIWPEKNVEIRPKSRKLLNKQEFF